MEQTHTSFETLAPVAVCEADCCLANRRHGIRLYRDEASRLNINESIHLTDNNFAVLLSVHHNLHCLVRHLQ